MDATIEQFEKMSGDDLDFLIQRLKQLREAKGELPPQMPDLGLERQQLADTSESIFDKIGNTLKEVFNFLVVKPANWVGKQIKEHPFRTVLIALAAFALWYYSAPLAAGLSAIKEKGMEMTSALLKETVNIDPTQVDVFDTLMNR
ncbi:hypothetical protein HYW83_05725 [Candidatus Peregrinibacteria bacterium]|nr:hypothetical protein [Candidatus Peregrinibacteria bacterium]